MNEYKFVEDEKGMGVMKKKVHQEGQPDTWVDDLKVPVYHNDEATKDYVNDRIADTIETMNLDEENGDVTVQYEDGRDNDSE